MKSAAVAKPKEEDFGLIRPSLIRQLRAILDQYPDDGQILKVCDWFIYDWLSHDGVEINDCSPVRDR